MTTWAEAGVFTHLSNKSPSSTRSSHAPFGIVDGHASKGSVARPKALTIDSNLGFNLLDVA